MPCGCFGKKKKKKEGDGRGGVSKEGPDKEPLQSGAPLLDVKTPLEDELGKTTKTKDVIALDGGDDCALLGFRATGSRPPSSYVDSPTSNSHPHTPSTLPAVASSASSPTSSVASSPTGVEGASCRAQLAQKRKEFFIELYPNAERKGTLQQTLPSTLPTAARARQFGKVRNMRPVSQPASPHQDSTTPEAPPPPGPHLLRHTPPDHPKTVPHSEGGFASPDFLLELRSASDELSRRWAMSEEEREATPSQIKEKAKSQRVSSPSSQRDSAGSPPHSPTDSSSQPQSVDVVVTPPSPPTMEDDSHDLSPTYPDPPQSTSEGSGVHEERSEHTGPHEERGKHTGPHEELDEHTSPHEERGKDTGPHEERSEHTDPHHQPEIADSAFVPDTPPHSGHDGAYAQPSAPPEYSDEDEAVLKKLSSALERDSDSFDISDEPDNREHLYQEAARHDLQEGGEGELGTHSKPLGKEPPSSSGEDSLPSPPTQVNHKEEDASAATDTNINISAHSPMD